MNEKTEKEIKSKKFNNIEFYNFLKENNLIILEAIVGSQAYGTNTPESDEDRKFVFVLPKNNIYGLDYVEQITITDDYVGYEIKRFMELVAVNNPTILELLATPEDCIVSKNPVFDIITKHTKKFITKQCKNSFGGYARKQIQKAKGQDKMMNWEQDKVVRKTPLDFCYAIVGNGTMKLAKWLEKNDKEQKFCGIVNIPNAIGLHALYYDETAHVCFSETLPVEYREHNKEIIKSNGKKVGLGYKGIEKEAEDGSLVSTEIRLSSIPKSEEQNVSCYFSYNKMGYIQHCKDYNQYQHWLKNRNEQRWIDVKNHDQKIDGKNLLHCTRLINMSKEIARGEGLIIRRPEAEYLKSIRKGAVDLETILKNANDSIKEMDETFENSNLSETVDRELINSLIIMIRKRVYGDKY